MTRPAPSVWSSPRTLGRICVAFAGVGLFLVAARTIDPGASVAAPALPTGPAPATATTPESEPASLGRFEAVDHALHVVATPEGPRYTITDAAGNILESMLHDEEVNSALESHGLEPGQPTDNADGALMLAGDSDFATVLD